MGDKRIKLNLWDTAGQEQYRGIVSSYVRDAFGIILAYDITDMSTFSALEDWIGFINHYGPMDTKRILVGNKVDLDLMRQVTISEADTFAKRMGYSFLECSAKEATNISAIFRVLTAQMLDEPKIRCAADKLFPTFRIDDGLTRPNVATCQC